MSSRSWQMRIQDILNAIAGIEQRTAGKTLGELQQDETLSKAILYDFMVIGEAARNVPAEIQSRYSKIPWRLMSDMRNIVAHEYFQIDIGRCRPRRFSKPPRSWKLIRRNPRATRSQTSNFDDSFLLQACANPSFCSIVFKLANQTASKTWA